MLSYAYEGGHNMKLMSVKEFKKDIFVALTDSIKKKLRAKGIKEEEILEDFERHRKARRRR